MNRFRLEKSRDLLGWWVLTDTENLVVLKFKEHEYNDSQQVTFIDEDKSIMEKLGTQGIVRILREMGEYMFTHWYSIALPTPVFEFRKDDKNDQMLLICNKFPKFTVTLNDDYDLKQLSDSLKAASEFVIKYKNKYGRS